MFREELADLGAVLPVLLCGVGDSDRRHGQHDARRRGPGHQDRQTRFNRNVHPLGTHRGALEVLPTTHVLKKVGLNLDRSCREILTSSGFPRAAAVQEQSFFRKSAGKPSADILVSRTMKGMVGVWLLSEV